MPQKSRDEEYAEFVGDRWHRFVRSAVLLGCSQAEAEDLAQTALMRCYVAWSKVRRADDPDAYAYRILLNCFRDSRRRMWKGERPTEELPEQATADSTESIAVADSVDRALARLSTTAREAVVLRYYAQLGEREMAQAMGVAQGTIKSRLSRALSELSRDPHLLSLIEGSPR